MRRNFGEFYSDVKLQKGEKGVLFWPAFFLLRRFLLSLAVIRFADNLFMQLLIFDLTVIVALSLIFDVRPLKN
jgi:hypothetical protein